jgi:ElaB/YqjD/DUF883 family membrane-anchored ribosome-binding protein
MSTATTKESIVKKLHLNSGSRGEVHEKYADVADDFRNFVQDVEALVRATAHLSGEELANAKVKLNERIAQAKAAADTFGATISERASKTAETANQYVHEKPWPVIGASAALGLLAGYLLSGRK